MSKQDNKKAELPPVDRELLDQLDREKLYEYIFSLVKDIWRVDGLYFLGIEKRRGIQEATDVDAECWAFMGKVEAKELKRMLEIDKPDPAQALYILRHTTWAISHPMKSFNVEPNGDAYLTIDHCRTQLIRLDKGLEPHPCRMVREGYLKAFAQECNPDLVLETLSCPPDRITDEYWCRWKFSLKK